MEQRLERRRLLPLPESLSGIERVTARAARGRIVAAIGVAALSVIASAAWAQATSGRASSIVIPVAASTTSFQSEVFVRNPNTFPIGVDVLYYEANGLASPGLKSCAMLTIAANAVVSFKLATQCPALATGSHFGMLILRDHATEKTNTFRAYSRAQHVTTKQGFSIEGFPEHSFSGRPAGVIGLKRLAAATPPTAAQPGYTPVCYVGSLAEPVNVSMSVTKGEDGSLIGNYPTTPPGSTIALGPYQLQRVLDIYAAVGATGDRENIRVRFANTATSGGGPAYVAFCTEQDNVSFGADFRIATSDDEANITKLLIRCRGTSDAACETLNSPPTFSIPDAATKHRFSLFIHHPDYLHCDIVGPNAGNLEIRLLAPAPSGQPVGPVVAGGNNASSFYYQTGPRNAVVNSNGFQTFWNMEIGPREGNLPTFPAAYGYRCSSGSGIHASGSLTPLTDDF